MRNYDLDSFLDLPRIPRFAFGSVYASSQNRRANAFVAQNSLETGGHIVLSRVNSKDLAPPPFGQFLFRLINQSPLFGIELFFCNVACFCDYESDIELEFGLKLLAIHRYH